VIYNPWSVLSFLSRGEEFPQAYWLSTSSNDLVRELLTRFALKLEPLLEELLSGGSIERPLEENVPLNEIHQSEEAFWSLLVFSGYLKAEVASLDALERILYRLSIPNREVRQVYATTFRYWIERRMDGYGGSVERLCHALLAGDAETFEEQLQAFVTNLLSFYDHGTVFPEQVYQGFVLGLLAALEPAYFVRSNRESGQGRPDVMIKPRVAGNPGAVGAVLELKIAKKGKKTPAKALSEGLAQIQTKEYAAEVRAAGASVVHAFAVAFDGKRVWVKSGETKKKAAAAVKKKKSKKPAI